jgi:hypothetical protein
LKRRAKPSAKVWQVNAPWGFVAPFLSMPELSGSGFLANGYGAMKS